MNCLADITTWLQSATGWPVYPSRLPADAAFGVVYEATQETDPAHGEIAAGGEAEVAVFVYHQRLSEALRQAREVEHYLASTLGGVLTCREGTTFRGGHIIARQSGMEGDLYFAMLRAVFYEGGTV